MKRFVIHIKGSTRYERMIYEMDSQYKGEYEIFDAIVLPNPKEGISESFKKIIRDNYDEPMIHILEDDVKFVSKNSRRVFEESMPDNFDIYLGGAYTFDSAIKKEGLYKIENFRSLHCVVIRKSAYDHFISHDVKEIPNIDAWVASKELNVYVCNPMVAVQHNGYSYNNGREMNFDSFLADKNILRD